MPVGKRAVPMTADPSEATAAAVEYSGEPPNVGRSTVPPALVHRNARVIAPEVQEPTTTEPSAEAAVAVMSPLPSGGWGRAVSVPLTQGMARRRGPVVPAPTAA